MKPSVIICAGIGGLVGALVWGGIIALTGYEVGYVAWGVGGLVGFGALLGGGRGANAATVAAGVTVVAIFAGKVIGVEGGKHHIYEQLAESLPREFYDQSVEEAKLFARLSGPEAFAQFMIDNAYTQATRPSEVTAEELDVFTKINAPVLEKIHLENLTFEEWRLVFAEHQFRYGMAEIGTASLVVESLSVMDAIFFVLGIATAYSLVQKADQVMPEQKVPFPSKSARERARTPQRNEEREPVEA